MTMTELKWAYGLRALCASKHAFIATDEDGNETLLSYGAPVAKKSKDGHISINTYYLGYSATTTRHLGRYLHSNIDLS